MSIPCLCSVAPKGLAPFTRSEPQTHTTLHTAGPSYSLTCISELQEAPWLYHQLEAQIIEKELNSETEAGKFGLSVLVTEDSSSQDYSIRFGRSVLNRKD